MTLIHDKLNWGRWGGDDQRGALNLIDAGRVLQALRVPRTGEVISLAIPIRQRNVPVAPSRIAPLHMMSKSGADYAAGKRARMHNQTSDSYITLSTHGTTHIDAMSHLWYDDEMYNGFPGADVRSDGARSLGIDAVGPIFARGVLLDLCAVHGVGHLQESHLIGPDEIEAAERQAGVTVQEGDAVLIRTGWLDVFWDEPQRFHGPEPGIGLEAANLLGDRGAALIGVDNYGVEVAPPDPAGDGHAFPVHSELLRNRGIHLMELLDLRELAAKVNGPFLFAIAPLKIVGGVGSPLNPAAVI